MCGKVLLVDDSRPFLELWSSYFEDCGYTVESVRLDELESYEFSRADRPQVIVIDPDMRDAMSALRVGALTAAARVPVVVVASPYARGIAATEFYRDCGAAQVLEKPIPTVVLEEVVRGLMPASAPSPETPLTS
jgi:CheY-like chemotaxis protein